MQINIYIPHQALQEYILNISTIDITLPPGVDEVVNPYPPTPFQSMMFYCNHPVSMGRIGTDEFQRQPLTVVVGPQLSRVNIKVHARLTAIRVDFLPGGMYRMLGIPMQELSDGGFDALDFFGREMTTMNEQLQNTPDLEQGKSIVERFFLRYVWKLKQILPFDAAMHALLHCDGNMAIEKVAAHACLSLKQFERKCHERIGMNPKMYARILRFSKAYRLHEAAPQISWTNIAHEAGYYDQMHMIRDFKVFAGVSPTVIEQQLLSTPIRMQRDLHY